MNKIDENIYYVYVYLDIRKQGSFKYINPNTNEIYNFDYEPFYIGCGHGERYKDHLKQYNITGKSSKSNPYKSYKINKILKETNKEPIIIKIKENLYRNEALNLEIILISIIGRKDKNKGTLTNLTDGGDGCKGTVVTEETKQKLREAHSGTKSAWWGKHHTEETRKKMSISAKLNPRKFTVEDKIKIGNKSRGRKWSEDAKIKASNDRQNIGNNFYGKQHNDKTKKFIGLNNSKYTYVMDNGQNFFDLPSKDKVNIRALFTYHKKDQIIYRGIKISRRNKNENWDAR